MEVILDTNFIISCMLKRIDFMEQLGNLGFVVKIPKEVIEELKDLKNDNKKTSRKEREIINVALSWLEEKKVKKIKLGGKVDLKLIERGKEGIYIATLDNGIKREIPNKVVINNAAGRVEVARD